MEYQKVAQDEVCANLNDLPNLEKVVLDIAGRCEEDAQKQIDRPWDSEELQSLRSRRRSAESAGERKNLSKLIWRVARH